MGVLHVECLLMNDLSINGLPMKSRCYKVVDYPSYMKLSN